MKPGYNEDSSWMLKFLTTASICGTSISMGICTVIHGATLLQLRSAIQISVEEVSHIFTTFAVGNFIGAVAAGLIPPRWAGLRRHLLAFLVTLLGAVMMGVIPYSGYLEWLLLAFGLFGFTYGYLDTDLTTIVTDIWADDNPPYLVAIRSSASVGVLIGGFICVSFVESVPDDRVITTDSPDTISTTVKTSVDSELSKLQQVYLIGVAIVFMTSVFMLMMLMTSRKQVKTEEYQRLFTAVDGSYNHDNITKEIEKRNRKINVRDVATIIFFCVTVATTMSSTAAFSNFLATFSIVFLKLSPQDGALLGSVYGGCSLLGSIISALVVKVIKPSHVVTVTCTLSIAAFCTISIFPHGPNVIWITAVLFGLGNIPTMCLTYVTAGRFSYLTKGVAAAFAASTGLAVIFSMLLVSSLFEYDMMVVMYFCLSCAMLGALTYLSAMLVNTREVDSF